MLSHAPLVGVWVCVGLAVGLGVVMVSVMTAASILLLDARWSNIQAALAADMERTMREQKEREALKREDSRL